MNQHHFSRKRFIKTAALAATGVITTPVTSSATASDTLDNEKNERPGMEIKALKNVKLETGFVYEEGEVLGTTTELFTIEIAQGKIKNVLPNTPNANVTDAKGLLMLPSFNDMHIHIDKTFYGGPWKATRKRQNGVKGMIALEQKILPEMLKTSTYRAEKMIELLQSHGSAFARSHVNIEPTSGLQSLENLQRALENKKDGFGAELVIFPQHGIYYTKSDGLMKEAAAMNIDFIGGLDPYSIDGSIEKPIDFIVQLALDHNKGIDIHLHEGGDSGLKTVEYLINRVNENTVLKGKTFLSHCFVLGNLESAKQEEMAEKMANAGIGIASTIPFGKLIMPIPTLYKYKVEVVTGNDSIIDHWSTWGTGSVLDKTKLMAQLYGYATEFDLSRSLKLATRNILPLDDKGNRQWPKPGDKANVVLMDASCSAEVVSRVSPVQSLIYNGKKVF